jgi:O-antigen/teichoic acid export membrane protein
MATTGYYWSHRLRRFDRAGISAMASKLAQSVASIILGIIPVRLPQGGGLIIGFAAGSALQASLTLLIRPKKWEEIFRQPFRSRITSAFRRYWRLCFSLVGSQGLSLLAGNAIVYAIGAIYGDVRLGLFALATRMVAAPSKLISRSIGDVYRQRAAQQYQMKGRFDDLMLTTFKKTLSIAIVPYLLAMILVVPVFSVVFGQEWAEAGKYARVLLVSGLFSFIVTPLDKAALIIGVKIYILVWHSVRLTGVISICAAAFYFRLHIMTCLWIYALLQISLYIFDFFYELRLAKGLHSSSIQVMS